MSLHRITYAIIGAGNGGQAFCAWLKHLGGRVQLWDRDPNRLEQLREASVIRAHGAINAVGVPDLITSDIREALNGALIIMVMTPASAHDNVAELIGPYLSAKQTIVLNPGRTAGALAFRNALSRYPNAAQCRVIETQSLLFTCRIKDNGIVEVYAIKKQVQIACLPKPTGKEDFWSAINTVYVNPRIETSTLITGLNNFGAIIHPVLMICNAGWIEKRPPTMSFRFYHDGVSAHVAAMIERMDHERMILAQRLGVNVWSLSKWLSSAYQNAECVVGRLLSTNPVYADIEAPRTIRHRYLFEDIPTGLVPMADLGRHVGLRCCSMEVIVKMAEQLLGVDLNKNARTLARLGLEHQNAEQILRSFEG